MDDLYGKYREPGWVMGWKAISPDGTTHGGYRWPLPNGADTPVLVEATSVVERNGGACPLQSGDGLCALPEGHTQAATSGTVSALSQCIGLMLRWRPEWDLGGDPGKRRLRRVEALGVFDVLGVTRSGAVANLRNADLRNANLWNADLRNADLWGANLRNANLWNADLRNADLWNADLRNADLRYADLRNVDLQYADLRNANLQGANLQYANLWNTLGVDR